ncbi:MAG: 6,7-dimethyl-8-ribityllumazine synthase [Deltaproteobacteria bacterium]|jgi:6,7-dimethyl-8-ribityllumazine synthase|nr:6,7-dimethyl-8-ribityllumazine synthase [Deltaproteobacteria bacterium]MBW2529992.1 6,7-dimethyl-8-ribityllumazine synthase [Deltaproteobacteria bacterium]
MADSKRRRARNEEPQGDQGAPKVIEGKLQVAPGKRFTIVASRFNHFIVDRLVEGAIDALVRHGASPGAITVVRVPGSWELPLATSRVAKAGKVDAIIALGALIRGATVHFDYLAAEVTKGLAQISLQTGVPVVFGVLTTDTIEQAIERAGTKAGNKGFEAALSAVELVSLSDALGAAER